MGHRIKLSEAAAELAATPDGRGVHLWTALVLQLKHGSPTEADRERFVDIAVTILEQVRPRLQGGEWEAWGWLPGGTKPVRIPLSLFERDDIDTDFVGNRISCAVITYDNVTVDTAMTGIPSVQKRKKASEREIKREFTAWVASLDEYPSKIEADEWAKDTKKKERKYSTTIVRQLHVAGNQRTRGEGKQKAGLKGS